MEFTDASARRAALVGRDSPSKRATSLGLRLRRVIAGEAVRAAAVSFDSAYSFRILSFIL